MIGQIRLAVALACVVVSTLVLVPLQLIAMKTGLWSEWRVPRLWHRVELPGAWLPHPRAWAS